MPIQYYRVYPSSHGVGVGLPPVLPAESSTKPARFAPVWHDPGPIAPPRQTAPGPTPPRSTQRGPIQPAIANRPQTIQPTPGQPRANAAPVNSARPKPIAPGVVGFARLLTDPTRPAFVGMRPHNRPANGPGIKPRANDQPSTIAPQTGRILK